jgi:hypothetical protein
LTIIFDATKVNNHFQFSIKKATRVNQYFKKGFQMITPASSRRTAGNREKHRHTRSHTFRQERRVRRMHVSGTPPAPALPDTRRFYGSTYGAEIGNRNLRLCGNDKRENKDG